MLIIEEIVWLRQNLLYTRLTAAAQYLTLGSLTVFHVFYPVSGKLMRSESCHPSEADTVIIRFRQSKAQPAEYHISGVNHFKNVASTESLASFEIDGQRYCCCSGDNWKEFMVPDVPPGFERHVVVAQSRNNKQTSHTYEKADDRQIERNLLQAIYGPNRMNIPIPDIYEICIRHAFHPILVFGYCACALWTYQAYYWYAGLLLFGILAALHFMTKATIDNLESLKLMVGKHSSVKTMDLYTSSSTSLYEDMAQSYSMSDDQLVVGDHFLVAEDMLMPCDAVLVSGRVVMNESMLTGESIPVTKVAMSAGASASNSQQRTNTPPLPSQHQPLKAANANIFQTNGSHDEYIELAEKRPGCVLFAGTRVKHVIGDCVCVTYRTGFRSAKGQLICSLLHPHQNFLNFFEDIIYVILFMFVLATVLFAYQAYYLYVNGYSNTYIVVLYFDALTDAIPIGLIICLIISTTIALARLRSKNMFVSESARVNMAGITSVACFDKTGTLTDEHLKFHSAVYLEGNKVEQVYTSTDSMSKLPRVCAEVMACCHDLSVSTGSNEPQGDLLEVELFRVSGWRMGNSNGTEVVVFAPSNGNNRYDNNAAGNDNNKHVILKTFEFSPETARSSALVRRPNNELVYLLKGSPESIIAISDRSTVPADIEAKLNSFAKRGIRVLAFAYRNCGTGAANGDIPLNELMGYSNMQFEKLENICFGGILCLVSNLKADTQKTIRQLIDANIHVNMITGDHIHTAIAVAVDCGIIPPATQGQGASRSQQLSRDTESTENSSDIESTDSISSQAVYHFIVDVNASATNGSGPNNGIVIIDTADDSIVNLSLLDVLRYAGAAKAHLVKRKHHSLVDQFLHESNRLLSAFQSDEGSVPNPSDVYNPLNGQANTGSFWNTRPVGLIHLAVTGKALQTIRATYPAYLLHSLVRYATVFARAKPNDKKFVVELLMATPSYSKQCFDEITEQEAARDADVVSRQLEAAVTVYNEEDCVLFCGDGANDMAALRSCTVGLSLCDVETSIAAPVTSRDPTPYAVVQLIIDGRWSIVTAYTLASFELYYAMLTTFMYVVLFGYGIMETDSQFTVIGFYQILVSVAILILREPSTPLSFELPPKRYFCRQIMVVLVPQFLLIPCFQLIALYVLSQQSFYVKFETDDPLTSGYAYEATVLMLMCMAQTMIAAAVSCIGAPFRQDWWSNVWFWCACGPTFGWLLYSTFAGDSSFAENDLDMEPIPTYFGFIMCGLYAANVAASAVFFLLSNYILYQPRVRRILPVVLEGKEDQ
jgi:magnesium-transporting ATPase (P-type)